MNIEQFKDEHFGDYVDAKRLGLSDKRILEAVEWKEDLCKSIEGLADAAMKLSKSMIKNK